jgi:hypothetical protein
VAVNLIVLAVTLLMAAFLGVWIFFPRLRAWMEMPKYRFLEQQRRFPGVVRDPPPQREEAGAPVVEGESCLRVKK